MEVFDLSSKSVLKDGPNYYYSPCFFVKKFEFLHGIFSRFFHNISKKTATRLDPWEI